MVRYRLTHTFLLSLVKSLKRSFSRRSDKWKTFLQEGDVVFRCEPRFSLAMKNTVGVETLRAFNS